MNADNGQANDQRPNDGRIFGDNPVVNMWVLAYLFPAIIGLVLFFVQEQKDAAINEQKRKEETMQLQQQMQARFQQGTATDIELRLMGVDREEYDMRFGNAKPAKD